MSKLKKATAQNKKNEMITSKESQKMPREKSISLEFLAEMVTAGLVMFRLVPMIPTPEQMVGYFHQTSIDSARLKAFWNLYDQKCEEGIQIASLLACISDEVSDFPVERRIRLTYALLRFFYYDFHFLFGHQLPPNPRYDSSRRDPTTEENGRLMKTVWEMLEHFPSVQAEMSKQENLQIWKREQRVKSINTYSKIKYRISKKFPQYQNNLRQKLLNDDTSRNTVKPPELFSRAQNLASQASKSTFDAQNKNSQASQSKDSKSLSKPGVKSGRTKSRS